MTKGVPWCRDDSTYGKQQSDALPTVLNPTIFFLGCVMSTVIESSQLTFDWDIESETNPDVRYMKTRSNRDSKASKRAFPASSAKGSAIGTTYERHIDANREARSGKVRHVGGLMLEVLIRYGITHDEFLDKYERQLRVAKS